ncbi:hypothetical protein IT397_02400 [Candidatus Nomurabacteria bacterium]|nr:hypothetical protein [Candidatus Nomurabacteria bacterium]
MLYEPFYDPNKSYEENFTEGPFGIFADGEVIKDEGEPQYDFFGYKVYSPFGIPAGPLINGKFVQGALDKGFDIVTYKTVRSSEYPCHPWPNVLSVNVEGDLTLEVADKGLIADNNYHEPLSITNSFGVPSQNPVYWQEDLKKVLLNVRKGQIVVGAFQGTKKEGGSIEEYINDYIICARMLKEIGIKVMEVNFSCPNEGTNNLLCFDIERSAIIAQAIKNEIGKIPLIVKVAYYQDEQMFRDFVKEIGSIVDGISTINTIAAPVRDTNGNQALPGVGRLRSGICGASIKWAGLEMVGRLRDLRKEFGYKYTIIGVGGVTVPLDFIEYRQAGADIVMSATGAMWNPHLAQGVKKLLKI